MVNLGLSDGAGVRTMTAALSSAFDVSGAAHLPAEVAVGSSVGDRLGRSIGDAAAAGGHGAVRVFRATELARSCVTRRR